MLKEDGLGWISFGIRLGRNDSGESVILAGYLTSLTSRPIILQVSNKELLPRGRRGYSCVRYHEVRHYVNWCCAHTEGQDSRASFSKLSRWLEDARALGSAHLVTVLVGNKSDREEEREVEWAEASRWAAEHGELIQDFSFGPWRLTSDDLNNAL